MAGGLGAFGLGERPIRAEVPAMPDRVTPAPPARDRSLQLEIEHAIERGLHILHDSQNAKGYWSTPETPGLTALVLTALVSEPTGVVKANPPAFVQKGYDYLLQCQQPDGGIYLRELANYCTSLGVMALMAADATAYEPVLKRARTFLIAQQCHFPAGSEKHRYDGGIGYGDDGPVYDVSNTSFALQALHETKYLADSATPGAKDLNWGAAVAFLERCQNLPSVNSAKWVKNDPRNHGGFVYNPYDNDDESVHTSYGSITYAGLLSYIYADLAKDDPRVTAIFTWLSHNYTVEENPGMGPAGVYYYYHAMAKGLSAYGEPMLQLADGRKVDWARELTLKLIDRQESSGAWVNTSGRWWEKDQALVTAYAVRALEHLHAQV
jgi:squalene-hopene/tetraprenyl-beta-curcumene cyclase